MASPGVPTAVYSVKPSAAEFPNAKGRLLPLRRKAVIGGYSRRIEYSDMRVSELGEYLSLKARHQPWIAIQIVVLLVSNFESESIFTSLAKAAACLA